MVSLLGAAVLFMFYETKGGIFVAFDQTLLVVLISLQSIETPDAYLATSHANIS